MNVSTTDRFSKEPFPYSAPVPLPLSNAIAIGEKEKTPPDYLVHSARCILTQWYYDLPLLRRDFGTQMATSFVFLFLCYSLLFYFLKTK